jgi:hypothetical protein
MQVVIKLSQEAAQALHGLQPSPEGERVRGVVANLGFRLEPIHPGTSDPSLQQYFAVEVGDRASAVHVVTAVQQDPSVAAAYVKPADELP